MKHDLREPLRDTQDRSKAPTWRPPASSGVRWISRAKRARLSGWIPGLLLRALSRLLTSSASASACDPPSSCEPRGGAVRVRPEIAHAQRPQRSISRDAWRSARNPRTLRRQPSHSAAGNPRRDNARSAESLSCSRRHQRRARRRTRAIRASESIGKPASRRHRVPLKRAAEDAASASISFARRNGSDRHRHAVRKRCIARHQFTFGFGIRRGFFTARFRLKVFAVVGCAMAGKSEAENLVHEIPLRVIGVPLENEHVSFSGTRRCGRKRDVRASAELRTIRQRARSR